MDSGVVSRVPEGRGQLIQSLEEAYWKGLERPQTAAGKVISQVVIFRVSDETYGVDVRFTRGITRFPKLVHIPGASEAYLGAMTFRGKVVPVVSFAGLIGLPKGAVSKESRVVVTGTGAEQFALAVDEVLGITEIALGDVHSPPATVTGRVKEMIRGQVKKDDRLIILVDIGAIMEVLCAGSEEVASGT